MVNCYTEKKKFVESTKLEWHEVPLSYVVNWTQYVIELIIPYIENKNTTTKCIHWITYNVHLITYESGTSQPLSLLIEQTFFFSVQNNNYYLIYKLMFFEINNKDLQH